MHQGRDKFRRYDNIKSSVIIMSDLIVGMRVQS